MKLGLVIPWFGRELKGGAEQQAWQIAWRLAKRGHTMEVLTTCCRSHQDDWSTNHLPEGSSTEPEGFTVRRFRVNKRNKELFDSACAKLINMPPALLRPGVSPVNDEESAIFANELIRSDALLSFLHANKAAFDGFILLPYLYGPVIAGVSAVADRACLQPCLHNESYAYLPEVADAFFNAAKIFLNSEGEAELAAQLFGPAVAEKSVVIGEGVEVGDVSTGERVQPRCEKFVLYLGRKEPGKNTDILVRAFTRFRRVRPNSKLRLVLAGHGKIEANGATDWIMDPGLVSNLEKERLLRDCVALAQPSTNESFSRAMMEAWRHGKPVAANRACLATATEVRRAHGGWLAESEDEWAAWFGEVDRAKPDYLRQLGANGQRHAEAISNWDTVLDRYEKTFAELRTSLTHESTGRAIRDVSINQFLPNLSYGDAISNHALWIRDELRKLGYNSEIFVRYIDARVAHECHGFSATTLEQSDAVIYHHSIGSEMTPHIIHFRGAKCLIYHNITPAEFVEPYRPHFAEILRQGRSDLRELGAEFEISYGDSSYNAEELAACGFHEPGVLPICIDPRKWAFRPDSKLMAELSDGRTNIIFVGRIAANKKQDDLVRAFARYRAFDPDARLFLVGAVEPLDPYADKLYSVIDQFQLNESVKFTSSVSDEQLAAYYRTAHLFWSMSEHEGFCVPLLEAMWFDVPIIAFKSSAIPETLGSAAFMFSDKSDLLTLAALAHQVRRNTPLRQNILAAQRERRRCFLPPVTRCVIAQLVSALLARSSSASYA